MKSVRDEGRPTLVVNAGNLLFRREQLKPEQVAAARLAADLILEAYDRIGCDAFNVGAYDLSLGVDYLLRKRQEVRFPFLSANLVDPQGRRYFQAHRIVEAGGVRIGIFGLIDDGVKRDKIPDGGKLAVLDPYETARSQAAALKAAGAEYLVLLTDMEGRSLRRIALLDLPIDLVVGSDRRNQISLPIVVQQTYITHLDRGGKSVGRLDLGLAPEGSSSSGNAAGWGQRVGRASYLNNFVQLRLSMPDDPVIGARVAETLQQVAEVQRETVASRADGESAGCGKEYVGAKACQACHPGRYRVWTGTAHARAYQTLVAKNRQYDEECVGCHVLAYECDDGAIKLRSIDGFANVQCESCHGRGDLHVAAEGRQPMIVDTGNGAVCLRCHTPERSEGSAFLSRLGDICTDR